MKKRFKVRKRRKNKLSIIIIILIIILILVKTIKTNKKVAEILINYNINTHQIETAIATKLKDPINILNYNFSSIRRPVLKDNPVFEEIKEEPLIYLYNTHQTEKYKSNQLEPYNIDTTVMLVDYILKEKLDYQTYIETESIEKILKNNNWNYSYSYKASRFLMENAYKKIPSLKYFIDIHRDSSLKEKTTLTINNINYARILFVVGKEHNNYEKNLEFVTRINEELKKQNKELSRGIYIKEGPGVNGIYNQDFNDRTILIEIGGVDNTIEEVNNTITILANTLNKIIGEEHEERE